MPTIPHNNLDVDDLVGMDYLTFAKKRMIRDMKMDKTIDNADKFINETNYKTGDTSSIINDSKELYTSWNKAYNLLVDINGRITRPINPYDGGADGNTTLITRDEASSSIDLYEKTNIINNYFDEITNKIISILNTPSLINKIPKTDADNIINLYKKWDFKFLDPASGVVSSKVLRLLFNPYDKTYSRLIDRRGFVQDRLRNRPGPSIGVVDLVVVNNNFDVMLRKYNFFKSLIQKFGLIYTGTA